MGHHANHGEVHINVLPPNQEKIKKIWMTALLLAVVTSVEFAIAFMVPFQYMAIRNSLFIILTIVKAFYIVAEFMHLGHEVKSLVYCIVIPIVFILWAITAFLMEGGYILFEHLNLFK